MSREEWTAVDHYFEALLAPQDAALAAALRTSDEAGLPAIAVSPLQGKQLNLLARSRGARRILEIGTLGGYSSIWLARALPEDGYLLTLELDEKHAAVATANLERAGLGSVSHVRNGPAAETLSALINAGEPPFDFVFIDADKTGYPTYLGLIKQLTAPGSVIVADNVVRQGAVSDPNNRDANVRAVREFTELVAADPHLEATVIQTVGSKGYDGFLFALVTG